MEVEMFALDLVINLEAEVEQTRPRPLCERVIYPLTHTHTPRCCFQPLWTLSPPTDRDGDKRGERDRRRAVGGRGTIGVKRTPE